MKHASSRLARLVDDQCLVDVWNDTATSDSSFDEAIQLFVASDGQLQVAWSDSFHLEIFAGVAS